MNDDILGRLSATIKSRRTSSAGASYTKQLLDGGPEKCARKFGEEAVETVIALINQDEEAVRAEAADLLYHLLVALECRGVEIADVLATLDGRTARSGLEEKASRQKA